MVSNFILKKSLLGIKYTCNHNSGKLPIETDDGVPSNLMCKPDTELLSAPELVPPIPPKTTKFSDERAPMDHQSPSNQDEPPPRPPKAK